MVLSKHNNKQTNTQPYQLTTTMSTAAQLPIVPVTEFQKENQLRYSESENRPGVCVLEPSSRINISVSGVRTTRAWNKNKFNKYDKDGNQIKSDTIEFFANVTDPDQCAALQYIDHICRNRLDFSGKKEEIHYVSFIEKVDYNGEVTLKFSITPDRAKNMYVAYSEELVEMPKGRWIDNLGKGIISNILFEVGEPYYYTKKSGGDGFAVQKTMLCVKPNLTLKAIRFVKPEPREVISGF